MMIANKLALLALLLTSATAAKTAASDNKRINRKKVEGDKIKVGSKACQCKCSNSLPLYDQSNIFY